MKVTIENYKAAATQRALNDVNEALRQSRETEKIMQNISEVFFALGEIENGVLTKDVHFTDYDARFGFTVKVEDQEMWGKIHKVTGPLMCSGKDAIGDARTKKVLVTMTPERDGLRYRVKFQFEKKLDKDDKCKIITKRVKETSVVCKL
jgi:hypothetical protein